MTAFDNSVSEGIVGGDTDASVIDFVRSLTEGIDGGDVNASIIDFVRSLSEGVKGGDTTASIIDFVRSLSEGIKGGDPVEAAVARPSPYIFPVGKLEVLDVLKAVQRPEALGLKKLDLKRIVEEILFVSVKGERNFKIVTTNTTVTVEDQIVYIDASLENIVITLPSEITAIGREFWLVRIDNVSGNTVSITPNINGSAQVLLIDESFTVHSNGTAYRLI